MSRSSPTRNSWPSPARCTREGFRGLVRRYEDAVKERIYDLVRDHDQTEDIAVTTWDKAFAALHRCEPRDFKAWILRIAYNAAIDEFRKKRPDTSPLDVDTDPTARGSAAGWDRPLASSAPPALGS